MLPHRHDQGFHLLELLVTLTIISVFMSFCFPLYTHVMMEVRRKEAASILTKLSIAMEQYHLEKNTYQEATLTTLGFTESVVNHHYRLIIMTATNNDYRLMIKPVSATSQQDAACGSLTLNAKGEKGISGHGTIDQCW